MNPDGKAGEHQSCPCCGGLSFEPFEDILDIDNNICVIEICETCSALVNRAALKRVFGGAALQKAQTADLSEVYPVDPHVVAFGATLEEEIPHFVDVIQFFLKESGSSHPPTEMISAEIGIGRGTFLRAASTIFGKCYGTDLDFSLFEASNNEVALPPNVVLLESLSHLPEPVDVIFAWHTFEHIPRLHDLIAAAQQRLKRGGHIYFQVPLFRPENVVESHYTFMNRRSIAVMAEMQRLEIIDIWTDHSRHFISSIFRKQSDT